MDHSPTGRYLEDEATNAADHAYLDACDLCDTNTYGPKEGADERSECKSCAGARPVYVTIQYSDDLKMTVQTENSPLPGLSRAPNVPPARPMSRRQEPARTVRTEPTRTAQGPLHAPHV